MRIDELNDEELKVFLEGQNIKLLRDIYTNIDSLRDKLKGFRPNKADKSVLVNTSFKLIRREKNIKLISILNNCYKDYVKEVADGALKLEKNGCSKDVAFAIAIMNGFNSDFRKVFYKLENIKEEDENRIERTIELIQIVDVEAKRLIEENSNPETLERIDSLEESINGIYETIDKANKEKEKQDKITKEKDEKVTSLISTLEKSIEAKPSSSDVNKMVQNETQVLKKEISECVKNNEFSSLKQELKVLSEKLVSVSPNQNADRYNFEHVKANDFSEMEDCDYLYENIGDVIEPLGDSNTIDVFREYLVETIYGNKPIVCSTKNIDLLSDIYASILTGGEYYSISLDEEYSLNKLENTIDSLSNGQTNLVIAIKGMIGIHNYRTLLNYLSKHPFTHKFLFDIHYEKQAKYMPIESLDEFYFYFGELKNKPIEYRFTHVFEKKQPIINNTYNQILNQLDADLENKEIFNIRFYGVLAYSIIPFIALFNDLEKSDVVNRVLDFGTRKKCEVVI